MPGPFGSRRLAAVEMYQKVNEKQYCVGQNSELIDMFCSLYARYPLIDPLLRAVQKILLTCVNWRELDRIVFSIT